MQREDEVTKIFLYGLCILLRHFNPRCGLFHEIYCGVRKNSMELRQASVSQVEIDALYDSNVAFPLGLMDVMTKVTAANNSRYRSGYIQPPIDTGNDYR